MSAETPGSPAPGPSLEPDLDPDPDPRCVKFFAKPASVVPAIAAMDPRTGRPYVKHFVKPVIRPPFKVGPPARAEPASTALAPTVLASIKNCEEPSAAIVDCSWPAAQEFGVRPPAKPNFLLASATAAADSLPTAGTRTARPPAKPNWLALALSLPTTDDLLPLPFIQLLAPLAAITSRSQMRCCVAMMDV
jgi:hypothetical protein